MRVKEYVALIFTFILPHGLQECVSIHLFFILYGDISLLLYKDWQERKVQTTNDKHLNIKSTG